MSVSYNQWTDKLDRLAAELPQSQWSVLPPADPPQEQYTWVKHQPGECAQVERFATVRWKHEGDLLWLTLPLNPSPPPDSCVVRPAAQLCAATQCFAKDWGNNGQGS